MNGLFTPSRIIVTMQNEIGRTNLYDRSEFNTEYRLLFQTMIKKMKEFGVEYNWKNKSFTDNKSHPSYRTFTSLEILQLAKDEKKRFEKRKNKLSHGMKEALDELKWTLTNRAS